MNVTLRPAGTPLQTAIPRGYMTGFGNGFETEALPGALPVGRNSPQRCPYGLYAEQVSGSPFTAPRATNERSWLYRIRPTVQHWGRFTKADARFWRTAPCAEYEMPIAPLRWSPIPLPGESLSFIEGMHTITTAGDAGSHAGMAAHVFLATRSMQDEYFYNADGELLIVPQQGGLHLRTEFGPIDVQPGEVAVIPRGVKFSVQLPDGTARGYVCENYGRRPRPAGAGADRRQLPGEPARLPNAARRVRGPGRGLPPPCEMGRHAVDDRTGAQPARRGGMARQLRAL